MDEQQQNWLKACLSAIESRLGWGSSAAWSNEDLELLSDRIFEQTHVKLSLSTMRRLWGRVKYTHVPNAATLNALACFLGFENWRAFCEATSSTPVDGPAQVPRKTSYTKPLLLAGLLVLLVLSIAMIWPKVVVSTGEYSFSSHKVSDALPNSVVFDYSAGHAGDTGIMIRQSWDPTLSDPVAGGTGQHTSIYYYPGYFDAKLMIGSRTVREAPVYIPTNGWKGIIQHQPKPIYLSAANTTAITSLAMQGLLGTTNLNDQWVEFDNFRPFKNVDPDDFNLTLTLQNTATVEQALCRRATLILRGKNSPVIIPLSDKGCTSDLNLYTGDTTVNGKLHDLSAFGCDFSKAQTLSLSILKSRLQIRLNDKHVFNASLKRPIGELVGLRVEFEGGGQVSAATLSSKGKLRYDLLK